ncbi:hypothetical protein BT69DRAFT_842419 [Atractiella rhizophila]|nr:hypothetical protein BT69DRAFT_842419 [Atractiella rhizophila]
MVSMDHPEHSFEDRLRYLAELAELHSTITSMATSILETRLSNPFQPLPPTDTRVFQISKKFTELKIVLRENNATVADTKKEVAAARTEVDKSALKLSNLEYEKSHLEKEIRKCEEFECVSLLFVQKQRELTVRGVWI